MQNKPKSNDLNSIETYLKNCNTTKFCKRIIHIRIQYPISTRHHIKMVVSIETITKNSKGTITRLIISKKQFPRDCTRVMSEVDL